MIYTHVSTFSSIDIQNSIATELRTPASFLNYFRCNSPSTRRNTFSDPTPVTESEVFMTPLREFMNSIRLQPAHKKNRNQEPAVGATVYLPDELVETNSSKTDMHGLLLTYSVGSPLSGADVFRLSSGCFPR